MTCSRVPLYQAMYSTMARRAALPRRISDQFGAPCSRLVAGRLAPKYTPGSVHAAGATDLDLLRRVFPGY